MKALAEALVAAQADMPAVAKDSTNPHFRNKFVSLDHLIAETRPVLNKHGLSIAQFPSHNDLGAPTLVTVLTHTSGEQLEYAAPLFLANQTMQGLGAALTYARRYAWAAALGIASEEDDDGNAASETTTTTTTTASNGATISEAQQKRLFAIAGEHSIPVETVKELVKSVAGVDSTAQVPKSKYDALVKAVEDADVPF